MSVMLAVNVIPAAIRRPDRSRHPRHHPSDHRPAGTPVDLAHHAHRRRGHDPALHRDPDQRRRGPDLHDPDLLARRLLPAAAAAGDRRRRPTGSWACRSSRCSEPSRRCSCPSSGRSEQRSSSCPGGSRSGLHAAARETKARAATPEGSPPDTLFSPPGYLRLLFRNRGAPRLPSVAVRVRIAVLLSKTV